MKRSAGPPPPKPLRATSFDPDVASAVGKAMRSGREALGHAQDAFALIAGVDRSYYGKLERGERQPSVGLLLRIAYALGVPGSDLLKSAEVILADEARKTARKRPASKSSGPTSSSRASSRER
ncbi:MAG: helix-turn-helix transcriptional regulator [Paucibacter sp.]|nr:helix-turn-helix transcriptional regulator [Roseateles sp.]